MAMETGNNYTRPLDEWKDLLQWGIYAFVPSRITCVARLGNAVASKAQGGGTAQ